MTPNLVYLYLLSPLHTGGASQEGNVVGIAREVHTNFPYLPSSSIRGRLRAEVDSDPEDYEERIRCIRLFGPELKDIPNQDLMELYEVDNHKLVNLEQGSIWIGDASLLWIPISSISHSTIWISCPLLLQRWSRLRFGEQIDVAELSSNLDKRGTIYLKDASIPGSRLKDFPEGKTWEDFVPGKTSIKQVLVVPDRYCETLIEMSLWRQVKVKLDENKVVTDGSFRYEEAIPPDALMYFSWGLTRQTKKNRDDYHRDFQRLLSDHEVLQLGGQESLGRGFVKQWMS